ncbi:E3 ubiquitin-protein ligase [Aureococcus anophagefferens]|uniref:E3 ubiquitin-protein ligase n=1 Tax=Aureococcus anophagefferens TaxID=44056 RepID=A0ABR1FQ28_AURAN
MADVPIDLTDNTDEVINLTSPRKSLAQEEDERLSAAAAILLASVPPDTLKPGKARRLCRKQLGDPSLTPAAVAARALRAALPPEQMAKLEETAAAEAARSAALDLLRCPRPDLPGLRRRFFKSDGCNKMTCACGAWSCYVCRAPIPKDVGYKHFCQTPHCDHSKCGKCRLYTDDAEDERAALAEAAAKAREESGADASVVEGLLDQAGAPRRQRRAGRVDFRAALDQARRRRAIPGGASTRSTRSAAARGSATCSAAAALSGGYGPPRGRRPTAASTPSTRPQDASPSSTQGSKS